MTDIQKIIEDEAESIAYQICDSCNEIGFNQVKEGCFTGANFALSQLQHENRWRKVSEELPDPYIAVLCRIKNPNIIIEGYIYEDNGIVKVATDGFEIYPYDNGEVTEWKPI